MTNSSPSKLYPKAVYDKEPIQLIRKVQNHGVLLACSIDDKLVRYASDNTELLFGLDVSAILGNSIFTVLEEPMIEELFERLLKRSMAYKEVTLNNQSITILAHKSGDCFVLEFEINTIEFNPYSYQFNLAETASEINNVSDITEKCDYVASFIKRYLGYDRVIVKQFDAEWNSDIVAEKKELHLESYLGLRFLESNIPQPVIQGYLKKSVQIVSEVSAKTVNVVQCKQHKDQVPLDLARSELQSSPPIVLEHLACMGSAAMLRIAIVHDNLLWGVIICHHYSPKYVNFHQRLSSNFLGQVLATSIHLNNTDDLLEQLQKNAFIRSNLIDQINLGKDISSGLSAFEYTINDLTNSDGAAIYIDNKLTTIGRCPKEYDIVKLIEKIHTLTDTQLYHTNCLSKDFEEAKTYKKVASGVLCLFISTRKNDAILWFKPEEIKTVHWVGVVGKAISDRSNERLSSRKSLEKWSVEQENTSQQWEDYEISEGVNLQKSIQDIIIANYDEVKKLNDQLKMAYEELESFSYSISHDLRAPLRGIDGFAHILKDDYYDNLDDFGKSSVDTIISSVTKMNLLIDDILEYSGLGKTNIQFREFPVDLLIQELLPDLKLLYNNVEVVIENSLPDMLGDRKIVSLLLKNLLENAMKYSSKVSNPTVTIGCIENNTFFIKDNGIGFDMKHHDKIFGVFNRLVNDEYPGSGIGLAIAKRIIDKHNGKIWVESEINLGSIFYFRLAAI